MSRRLLITTVSIAVLASAFVLAPPPASAALPQFSDVTAVIGYDDSLDASIHAFVAARGGEIVGMHAGLRFAVVATENPTEFIASAAGEPGIRYAERDPLIFPEHVPNDQYWNNQWGMRAINADDAWDTQKGEGAIVAVLDTGVDYHHADLASNIWLNLDDLPGNGDEDGNGYVDDFRGWDFNANDNDPDTDSSCGEHGTHVAGIVAAQQDNVVGVTGVAPATKIMALRTICGGNHLSAAALAVAYAADNGANIVTCSWYATYTLTAFEEAVRDAYLNDNVLFVKSAGNQNGGPVTYPGTLPEYIAVSSLNSDLSLSSFSSKGTKVELAAPGGNVYSTYSSGATSTPLNAYAYLSGTSMAAPHVAGTAALLFAAEPGITNVEVRAILSSTARDLGAAGRDTSFGYGIVDAQAALGALG